MCKIRFLSLSVFLRLEARTETHPQPLLIEGRFEVPSKKRGFKGCVYCVLKNKIVTELLPFLPSQLWFSGGPDFVRAANGRGLRRVVYNLRTLFNVCCYPDHGVSKGV